MRPGKTIAIFLIWCPAGLASATGAIVGAGCAAAVGTAGAGACVAGTHTASSASSRMPTIVKPTMR